MSKMKVSFIWLNLIVIITKVAQSVQRLHPHMREDVHTTRHCVVIVNDTLVNSMPSVQQTLLSLFRFLTV